MKSLVQQAAEDVRRFRHVMESPLVPQAGSSLLGAKGIFAMIVYALTGGGLRRLRFIAR